MALEGTLVTALAAHYRSPLFSGRPGRRRQPVWTRRERVDLLFGAIMDQQVVAGRAWDGPHQLRARLHHLSPRRIAAMPAADLEHAIRGAPGESLHRFPARMAGFLRGASQRLVGDYRGDPGNIWADGLDASEVHRRLGAFPGIGDKIASMMVRILLEEGAKLGNLQQLDVAVDRHVARTLFRVGALPLSARRDSFRSVKQQALVATRGLFPPCPGALDFPLFDIGRTWCVAGKARCRGDDEVAACPLHGECRRDRIAMNLGG